MKEAEGLAEVRAFIERMKQHNLEEVKSVQFPVGVDAYMRDRVLAGDVETVSFMHRLAGCSEFKSDKPLRRSSNKAIPRIKNESKPKSRQRAKGKRRKGFTFALRLLPAPHSYLKALEPMAIKIAAKPSKTRV
jgi:hypothetical protein